MSVRERVSIGRHPQSLAEYGSTVPIPHNPRVWLRMGASTTGVPSAARSAFHNVSGGGIHHVGERLKEEFSFSGAMDLAKRGSNGLRKVLSEHNLNPDVKSQFGAFVLRAFENPDASDHNHFHMRRVEKWMEALFLNVDTLRNNDVKQWLDSAYLSAYWHDFDQLMGIQRNFEKAEEDSTPDLKVKKGHALGAATMLLALHKRYARERGVSEQEAWRIMAGAAVMIIPHEAPETLHSVLGATKSARGLGEKDNTQEHDTNVDLINEFYDEDEHLDLTTLSPRQIVRLLQHEKKDSHIAKTPRSKYGLHPLFEAEYAKELEALAEDEKPILEDLTPESRKGLETAAEAAVWADWTDMISTPVEAIFRTLHTQYSRNRPFMSSPAELDNLRTFLNKPNLSDHELLLHAVLHGPGNINLNADQGQCDSDVRRMVWEFVHSGQLNDGPVGSSKFNHRVNRENAYMGLLAFRRIGANIMRGDMSDLDEAYERRQQGVIEKALIKAGARKSVAKRAAKSNSPNSVDQLSEPALQTLQALKRERDQIKDELRSKPQGDAIDGVFPESAIKEFLDICDAIEAKLRRAFNLSQVACTRLRHRSMRNAYAPSTPFNNYSSIGEPKNIRTIFAQQT